MSGFSIGVNDRTLRLGLQQLGRGFEKPPILRAIGNYMVGSVARTFRDQGSPAGSWQPLKAWTKTGARNRVRFSKKQSTFFKQDVRRNNPLAPGRLILIVSGRLKNSVTFRVVGSAVLIGSNLKYAAIQHYGGATGRKHAAHIPARPFVVFRPEDPENIAAIANEGIAAQIKKAGL